MKQAPPSGSSYHLAQLGTLLWALNGPFAVFGLLVPAGGNAEWFQVWQYFFVLSCLVMLFGRFWEHRAGRLKPLFGGEATWPRFFRDTFFLLAFSFGIWAFFHYLSGVFSGPLPHE